MNVTVLAVIVALCLCVTEGAPDGRLTRKQQRPTRGFKNVEMMTARGFGKRAQHIRKFHPSGPLRVAYDFGKRSGNDEVNEEDYPEDVVRVTRGTFKPNSNILIARGFGKRQENGVYGLDNFWENLEASQEKDGLDGTEEKPLERYKENRAFFSIPMDWFVNEMINNPDFARSVVRKFIDINQDGMLSSDELLRNI